MNSRGQLCCAHLLSDLDDAAQVYPDAEWPTQIADALRALIHEANLARDHGLPAIPTQVHDTLLRRLRNGRKVGLSDTLTAATRPGQRKARLLLEVLRDREADVLRFAHDLQVPPTSNQAERDLRPSKIQQKISGRLTSIARTEDRYAVLGYISTAAKDGIERSPRCATRSPADHGCPHSPHPPDNRRDPPPQARRPPGNTVMTKSGLNVYTATRHSAD